MVHTPRTLSGIFNAMLSSSGLLQISLLEMGLSKQDFLCEIKYSCSYHVRETWKSLSYGARETRVSVLKTKYCCQKSTQTSYRRDPSQTGSLWIQLLNKRFVFRLKKWCLLWVIRHKAFFFLDEITIQYKIRWLLIYWKDQLIFCLGKITHHPAHQRADAWEVRVGAAEVWISPCVAGQSEGLWATALIRGDGTEADGIIAGNCGLLRSLSCKYVISIWLLTKVFNCWYI